MPGNLGHVDIDQVVIGSCTNGRIEDLEMAAEILKGKKVAKHVRCIIIPATPAIYREAMRRGYFQIFLDAGCIISPPTCGPCLGGHMGVLAKGETGSGNNKQEFHRQDGTSRKRGVPRRCGRRGGERDKREDRPSRGGSMILKGRVWKFGDNIDTDIIIPARYLAHTDPKVLGQHCMEPLAPDFPKKVEPGDIIVAGNNFGCGSSREHAPLAIGALGIPLVIARTFARIFYRNAFNKGLALLEADIYDLVEEGDEIEVDISRALFIAEEKKFRPNQFPPSWWN